MEERYPGKLREKFEFIGYILYHTYMYIYINPIQYYPGPSYSIDIILC